MRTGSASSSSCSSGSFVSFEHPKVKSTPKPPPFFVGMLLGSVVVINPMFLVSLVYGFVVVDDVVHAALGGLFNQAVVHIFLI